jgi:hypothetical protein
MERVRMAHTYRVNPIRALVVVTGGRRWSGEDLVESRWDVVRTPDFEPAFDWVYDLRRVRRVAFPPRQMERAVEQFHTLRDEGWVDCSSRSVLVGRIEDVRVTGELYYRKVDCPSVQFRITHTLDAAYRWLDHGRVEEVADKP